MKKKVCNAGVNNSFNFNKDEIELRESGSGKKNNSDTESTELEVYLNKYKYYENMTLIYLKEAPEDISNLGGITGDDDEVDINLKNIDSSLTAEKGSKDISDLENCSISG